MPQLPYNDKHPTPSPVPIVRQWQAILIGLQEIGRKVSVGGAAWEIVGATIVEVEDHEEKLAPGGLPTGVIEESWAPRLAVTP